MKRLLCVLSLYNIILGCHNDRVSLNIQTNKSVVIIDSFPLTNNRYKFSESKLINNYSFFYLGPVVKEIFLHKNPFNVYRYRGESYNNDLHIANNESISIEVDTCFDLTLEIKYWSFKEDPGLSEQDSIKNFKSYPVFIKNKTQKKVLISDCWDSGILSRQIKNNDGHWIDVEVGLNRWCSTGCFPAVLNKDEVIVTKMLRYTGDKKLETRLKYGFKDRMVYSNSFFDYYDEVTLNKNVDFIESWKKDQ